MVVRLDDTVTRANLAIVTKGLNELLARKARLSAERDGASQVTFPPELTAQASDPDAAAAMASEVKLFNLRRAARDGQRDQLRQQIAQLGQETQRPATQQASKTKEIDLVRRRARRCARSLSEEPGQLTRLTSLEREAAGLEGERGALVSSMAQTKGKIAETELKVLQVDQDMSSDVGKELREVDAKMGSSGAQGHGRGSAQAY